MIVVGADNEYIPKLMGWETARTMDEALEMAKDTAPPSPDIVLMHMPADRDGRSHGLVLWGPPVPSSLAPLSEPPQGESALRADRRAQRTPFLVMSHQRASSRPHRWKLTASRTVGVKIGAVCGAVRRRRITPESPHPGRLAKRGAEPH